MGAGERRARLAPSIGEEFERPTRGDRRIELAQGPGRGVARIGEHGFPASRPLLVQREKTGALEIDLATHLDQLGPAFAAERLRYRVERAKVRRDILAGSAVAARRAERETA